MFLNVQAAIHSSSSKTNNYTVHDDKLITNPKLKEEIVKQLLGDAKQI